MTTVTLNTQILRNAGLTKASIEAFAENIVSPVLEGEQNPLELYTQIKALEEALKVAKDKIKDEATKEAEKYGNKPFDFMGVGMQVTSVKTEYDFTGTGDYDLFVLEEQLETAKQKVEDRKATLKTLKTPTPMITSEGEAITVNPPIKKVTTGIKTTFKK